MPPPIRRAVADVVRDPGASKEGLGKHHGGGARNGPQRQPTGPELTARRSASR